MIVIILIVWGLLGLMCLCHKKLLSNCQVLDCSHLDRRLTVNYIGDDVASFLDDVWGTGIGCCFPR
jgi:hypothetical protein